MNLFTFLLHSNADQTLLCSQRQLFLLIFSTQDKLCGTRISSHSSMERMLLYSYILCFEITENIIQKALPQKSYKMLFKLKSKPHMAHLLKCLHIVNFKTKLALRVCEFLIIKVSWSESATSFRKVWRREQHFSCLILA